jgi:signal transduction histidine kinase
VTGVTEIPVERAFLTCGFAAVIAPEREGRSATDGGAVTRYRGHVGATTLLALTGAYLVAGKLGLSLALVHASASPVWPPTGISLAAFLLLGRAVWPAIFAGAFLVNVTTAGSPATALGIALGNTLEGLAGAWLVRRFAGGTAAFDRPRDVFAFVGLAGLLATAISPSLGVTSLCLGGFAGWPDFGDIWLTWWLGDAGGAVVVAPALVLWARGPWPRWTRARLTEAIALATVIAGLGAIAFGGLVEPPVGAWSLSFLCLPPTVWAAFRFGRRETAAAVVILSGIAVWFTVRSETVFAGRENEALMVLQLFMGVVAVTALSLAAVVSQRRRAQGELAQQAAELARSNAELDEFARAVSHDIKAPLRGISTLAAGILEDGRDVLPAEALDDLALLVARARRMCRLIDGVLGYSRIARPSSALELVDSQAVVEEVVDALGAPRGVLVRIEGVLPLLRCDPTQLSQVFHNLIQNAVQHLGHPNGEVVVACREAPAEVEFSVRDDGVGIPQSHLDRIFEMFHVVDPEGGTTGIGLAIVRRIVEANGGSVSAASQVGRGSLFRFSIPKRSR